MNKTHCRMLKQTILHKNMELLHSQQMIQQSCPNLWELKQVDLTFYRLRITVILVCIHYCHNLFLLPKVSWPPEDLAPSFLVHTKMF